MQRLFKYILTFLCALIVFPIQVHAADIYTEGYLEYRVEDDAISICGYFGSESEVTVPAFIAGYPVSEIASGAFEDAETVEKVNLPDTIMRIEEGAFGRNQTVVYDSNTSDPKPTVPDGEETPENSENAGTSSGNGSSGSDSAAGSGERADGTSAGNDSSNNGSSGQGTGDAADGQENSADTESGRAGNEEAEVSLEDTGNDNGEADDVGRKDDNANRMSAGIYAVIVAGIAAAVAVAVIIVMKLRKKKS